MPGDPHIHVRPMFGNLAGFINGNMFAGLFGQQIFIRLPEDERSRLIEQEEASLFSPMPDKPMKEYVILPEQTIPIGTCTLLLNALFNVRSPRRMTEIAFNGYTPFIQLL